MKRLVAILVPLFFCLTLWADVCPRTGFLVEPKSLDPQVDMGIQAANETYVVDDGEEYGSTECDYYAASLYEIFEVSYTADGMVREMRKLSSNNGLISTMGTECTAPGIYLFYAPSARPGMYGGNCGCTFVSHGEECGEKGEVISHDDYRYSHVLDSLIGCDGSLENAIAESQKEEYQDTSAITDNDSKKGGCSLTIID